jgi:hypothetical protein
MQTANPTRTANPLVPKNVGKWITDMVNGNTTVKVGHMMFSTDENFQTEPFEQGLFLIRESGLVEKWCEDAKDSADRKARLSAVREYAADAIRNAVIAGFNKAGYPGD